MAGIKINFIYQTLYQILASALPLITSPYISRVLGAEQLGIYTYIATIANYFAIVAGLGIGSQGTRSIALNRVNPAEMSKIYSQIRVLQCVIAGVVSIIYAGFIILTVTENHLIYWMQLFLLINCAFDVCWFYNGIEEFRITVSRNIFIKMLTIIGIFTLVDSKDDAWIYAFILAGGTLIGNLILWIHTKKYIKFIFVSPTDILTQLKPSLLLFIPYVAMTLYHQMDKTMLGGFGLYTELGYYSNADKIVNITIGIVSGFGSVSLPRIAALLSEKNMVEYKKIIRKSFSLIMFLCAALAFGIASIANDFSFVFFGEEFAACGPLIIVLSMDIFFKAIATVVRNQYLMPLKKDWEYISSVFLGVVINFCLNWGFIQLYGAMGAAIATLITEIIVCIIQMISMNKFIPILGYFRNSLIYILCGILMFVSVRSVSIISFSSKYVELCIEVFVGAVVYTLAVFTYWKINRNDPLALIWEEYWNKLLTLKNIITNK